MGYGQIAAAAGGNIVSSYLGHVQAMRRQTQAQNWQSDMFGRRYQMTVADMKAAGLNPMLAASQGGGSPGGSSAASASGPDVVGAINQTRLASAQAALLKAQKIKVEKEGKVIGPKAWLMETVEEILRGWAGSTAEAKKNKMSGVLNSIKSLKKPGVIKRPAGKLKSEYRR